MKRLLISLGVLLALAMATPDTMAQQRRGNGGAGHGRDSNGADPNASWHPNASWQSGSSRTMATRKSESTTV